jgi:glycosyltransferase involved in cell wall biosynthesis
MDYRPNIDAVRWFAENVLPLLRARSGDVQFWIVGTNPAAAVRGLGAREGVRVTGRVPDVRPYLRHAACVVAPLQIARGIQNKVLEAMAMARPVVLTPQAVEGIELTPSRDALVAEDAVEFAAHVQAVLGGGYPSLGAAARRRVAADYQWNFDALDRIMAGKALADVAAH